MAAKGKSARRWEVNRYGEALLGGDERSARRLLDGLLENGLSLRDIYLTVLAPALEEIGELWHAGRITIADEHLATEATLAHMARIRASFPAARGAGAARALVACAQREDHYVGARMAADLLEVDGWRVDFLGRDVPTENLVAMVAKRRPDVVGLSVTVDENVKYVWRAVEQIAALAQPPRIILGGQALIDRPVKRSAPGSCAVAADAAAGVALARDLLRGESPKVVLAEYLVELGRRIRELRAQRRWTQQNLAEATGLTRAYVVAVESGKQNVSLDVVIRIANALAVRPEQLLAGLHAGEPRRENVLEEP